jgi:hypothetical protein
MNLLSHFLTRPPEVRRFKPVAPMVQPSWVERALSSLDRGWDRFEHAVDTKTMDRLLVALWVMIASVAAVLVYFAVTA